MTMTNTMNGNLGEVCEEEDAAGLSRNIGLRKAVYLKFDSCYFQKNHWNGVGKANGEEAADACGSGEVNALAVAIRCLAEPDAVVD